MSLFVIPNWFSVLAFAALAVLAIWKGGAPERAIAVTQAVETGVNIFVCHGLDCRFGPHALWATQLVWRPLIEDGAILAICLAYVVRTDRYWVIWACSFALLCELSDLTMFQTGVTRWARLSASLMWTYALSAAVLWGVLTHRDAENIGPSATARSSSASRSAAGPAVPPPDTNRWTRP